MPSALSQDQLDAVLPQSIAAPSYTPSASVANPDVVKATAQNYTSTDVSPAVKSDVTTANAEKANATRSAPASTYNAAYANMGTADATSGAPASTYNASNATAGTANATSGSPASTYNASNATAGTANATSGAPASAYNAATAAAGNNVVDQSKTAQGIEQSMIDPNNPYYQAWATAGAQQAASKGFTNGSMMQSGILNSIMQNAQPIATNDAAIYANAANTNANNQTNVNTTNANNQTNAYSNPS
jgi:hypothetical protein